MVGTGVKRGVFVIPGVPVGSGVPGVAVGTLVVVGPGVTPIGGDVGPTPGVGVDPGKITVGVPPGPIGVGVGPPPPTGVGAGPVTEFLSLQAGASPSARAQSATARDEKRRRPVRDGSR